ncbi:MAG: hypothetical protein KDD67_12750 [Ignavibacteriae bacterium]|nr:hypothetical protein [Ignavibacteriota bacterium]MCB9214344.1 hypothetical protein [Ignavibacteria bacterium]
MENGRVVELLSDMLIEMRGMKEEQKETNRRFENLDHRVERLEEQQAKTNLALAEMRTSFMRVADQLIHQSNFEQRIAKLEEVVFSK